MDFTFDRVVDFCEPSFAQIGRKGDKNSGLAVDQPSATNDLSHEFERISLNKSILPPLRFETNLRDDEEDDSADRKELNDFHLAEIDLIECLLRTNIIQRIQ